jgi:hypothetical protein
VSAPAAPNCWRLLEAPGQCKRTRLLAAGAKMRGGAPGLTRKRFKAGYCIDAQWRRPRRSALRSRPCPASRCDGRAEAPQRIGGFL